MKSYRFIFQGLDCPNCAKKIENKITSMEEYKDVIVNFSTLTLSFKTENQENVEERIRQIVKSVMPDVNIVSNNKKKVEEVQRNNKDIGSQRFCGVAYQCDSGNAFHECIPL